MKEGVKNCDVFVAIMSESYLHREFCQVELRTAQLYRKPVLCFIKMVDHPELEKFKKKSPSEFRWLFNFDFINIDVTDMEIFKFCLPMFLRKGNAALHSEALRAPELTAEQRMTPEEKAEVMQEATRKDMRKNMQETQEAANLFKQENGWRKEAKSKLAEIKMKYDYCGDAWETMMKKVCDSTTLKEYNVHILNQSAGNGNGPNGGKVEGETTPERVDITLLDGWANQFTYTYVVRVAPIGKKWQVLNDGNSKGKTWKSSDDQCWKGNPKNPGDFSGWVKFS